MTEDLRDLLDIEEIDRDIYRARSFDGVQPGHLYGGQVAAQALRAASLTVADDRSPHSLHGYFLRAGSSHRPLILQVHRDRDGGSFSARRVLAIQNGEVLFSGAASFHSNEESPEYQLPMPPGVARADVEALGEARGGPTQFFQILPVPAEADDAGVVRSGQMWTRSRVSLPDDDIVHACALTYVSDFGSGFANVEIEGLAKGGPSLDHCIWFHLPIRLDDWVFINLWPLRASGARGTYMGSVHDAEGTLGCVLTQEALLRPFRPRSARPGDPAEG